MEILSPEQKSKYYMCSPGARNLDVIVEAWAQVIEFKSFLINRITLFKLVKKQNISNSACFVILT